MAIYDVDGNTLQSIYNLNRLETEAFNINGTKIFPDNIDKYQNYNVNVMSYVAYGGLQGFAYYDGKIVMVTGDDTLKIANAETGSLLATISASVGHGNGIIFSDEFYDENDPFPLLVWRTSPSKISYYRITLSGSEVIKEYELQTSSEPNTVWYGMGLDGRWLYTIGYTSGSYIYSASNKVILAKYDLQSISNNTVPLVYEIKRDWFECIQGCQFHDDFLWVTSGITSQGRVYAINPADAEIELDITSNLWNLEIEGCAWENDYTLIVGLRGNSSNFGMYKVTFPDAQPT